MPYGMRVATAWSWRLLVIFALIYFTLDFLQKFIPLLLPVFVAALLASVARPVAAWLHRKGLGVKFSSIIVFVATITIVGALVYFVGAQIAANAGELTEQASGGLKEVEVWLVEGPLKQDQVSAGVAKVRDFVQHPPDSAVKFAKGTAGTMSNILTGALITAFCLYFFISDGKRIGMWLVKLFPKNAEAKVASSGTVAWNALTKYTQATTLVAFVDSLGIMLVAWLLGLPLILPIGVLVFIGSFIPMIGGLVTGMVAVLIALITGGPTDAAIMLGGVIAVQQIEGNLLQPLIMGKFVSVHPLAVLLGLAFGFSLAGVPGAFVAVPIIAVINAVALHLSGHLQVGDEQLPSLDLPPEDFEAELSQNADSGLDEVEEMVPYIEEKPADQGADTPDEGEPKHKA